MPRDVSGRYTLPSGYRAEDGTTIFATQHNTPLEDLADSMTGSLARSGVGGMSAALNMNTNKITSLATGTDAADAITKAQLDALAASIAAQLVPTGVVNFTTAATAPTGWLIANGAAVSRTTYAALFAVISTTYGVGDGSTTFNIPDLRGEFLRGLDLSRGVDTSRVLGSAQSHAFAAHNHTAQVNDPGHQHVVPSFTSDGVNGAGTGAALTQTTILSSSATTGVTVAIGQTGSTETRPRNLALTPIIKF